MLLSKKRKNHHKSREPRNDRERRTFGSHCEALLPYSIYMVKSAPSDKPNAQFAGGAMLFYLIIGLSNLIIVIFITRCLAQFFNAGRYSILAEILGKITGPVIRLLGSRSMMNGRLTVSGFAAVLILIFLKYVILTLVYDIRLPFIYWAVKFLLAALQMFMTALFWLMIVQMILSWLVLLSRQTFEAPARFTYELIDPFVRPLRKIIPPVFMLDLAFMAAMILLFLVNELISYAVVKAFGEVGYIFLWTPNMINPI